MIELFQKEERRSAVFSDCRKYRYQLEIVWDDTQPLVQFIGLNPSTADEYRDDNTIRKCKKFAANWGFGGIVMTNLFAFRDTYPVVMKKQPFPIGERPQTNDFNLMEAAMRCKLVVAAWGNHGTHEFRSDQVVRLFTEYKIPLKCFRITKIGMPEHPLYMPYDTPLIDFYNPD
jgi:hypothetical protein